MRRPLNSFLRCALAGAVLLCGLGALRADARKDVKVALVIGNANYNAANLKLANAGHDAESVAAALEKDGFEVTLKLDVSKSDFDQILADYNRISEKSDVSLFYYAGHGVQYKKQNYLLPTDNIPKDNKDIKFKSVSLQDVIDASSDARKAKIIVLDACRNSKPDPGKKLATRAVTGVGDGDGLAEVTASEGLAVFFSAQAGHQALDADGSDHSPFATAFIKHLEEPNRNLVNVFDDVTHDVKVATQDTQVPETFNSLGETIILNPRESSAEVWARIKQARDPKELRQFIHDYPDAPEADTASLILDQQDAERRARQKAEEDAKRVADLQKLLDQARQQQEAAVQAKEATKLAEEQRKAAEAAKAKEESDRLQAELAARKAEADRAQAEQVAAEKAHQDQERMAQEAAVEQQRRDAAERKRREDAVAAQAAAAARAQADAEEAHHRAELEADIRAKDAAQRQADEKTRLAALELWRAEMLAEARERRADIAAMQQKAEEDARIAQARQDEIKRQRDAEEQQKKVVAAACAADAARLADFIRAGQSEQIATLQRESICPTTPAAADKALTAVAMAAAQTCARESALLSKMDAQNAAALKSAADGFKCATVRRTALDLAQDAERADAEMAALCAKDAAEVAKVDAALPGARDVLTALAASKCVKTRVLVDKAVAEIDERVTIAQEELVKLQCLAPNQASHRFDSGMQDALKKYLTARNAATDELRLNQDLVDELGDQTTVVCAPATLETKVETGNPTGDVAPPPHTIRVPIPPPVHVKYPPVKTGPVHTTHTKVDDGETWTGSAVPVRPSRGVGGSHNSGAGGGGGAAPKPAPAPAIQVNVPAI